MSKRYIIYIRTELFSGFYTGKNFISQTGVKYPGIIATKDSNDVQLYITVKQSIMATAGLVFNLYDHIYFEIYEKYSNRLVYKANYVNGALESEQRF